MKTNINLYHASCQTQKMHFNFSQLIMLLVACVIFSALAAFATIELSKSNESKRINAQSELLTLQNEFTSLLETEAKRNATEQKTKVKKALLQNIADKQNLLASLNELDLKEGLIFLT